MSWAYFVWLDYASGRRSELRKFKLALGILPLLVDWRKREPVAGPCSSKPREGPHKGRSKNQHRKRNACDPKLSAQSARAQLRASR